MTDRRAVDETDNATQLILMLMKCCYPGGMKNEYPGRPVCCLTSMDSGSWGESERDLEVVLLPSVV